MVIHASRRKEFDRYAQHIIAHKSIYIQVEHDTGVPWYMVGLIHLRESSLDFTTYLGNGDPLSRPPTHVPAGRGPFSTFVAGAVDAIHIEKWGTILDWRLEKQLYHLELFNGTGYSSHGLPSPYLWGGTNVQRPGKYVADGVWDGGAMDSQPGCAPVLVMLMLRDRTIFPKRED